MLLTGCSGQVYLTAAALAAQTNRAPGTTAAVSAGSAPTGELHFAVRENERDGLRPGNEYCVTFVFIQPVWGGGLLLEVSERSIPGGSFAPHTRAKRGDGVVVEKEGESFMSCT